MTINGEGYKELFLRCISEGYDAAQNALNRRGMQRNPYDEIEERYEYEAWLDGWCWYSANVH